MKPLTSLVLIVSSAFFGGCRKSYVSSCVSQPEKSGVAETKSKYSVNPIQKSIGDTAVAESLQAYENSMVYKAGFVNSKLLDQTLHFYDEGHGNQIEYLSKDGNAYLWYPGNSVIVKGKWTVIEDRLIAFSFQKGTYNPVTKENMDSWDYRELEFFVDTIKARRKGDVFSLTEGLPRVLSKSEPIALSTFEP